jgi:hypothetical protein
MAMSVDTALGLAGIGVALPGLVQVSFHLNC